MTEHVSQADVRAIAEYARIGLTAEEVVSMTADLNAIIDMLWPPSPSTIWMGVPPTFHPIGEFVECDARGQGTWQSFTQEVALFERS